LTKLRSRLLAFSNIVPRIVIVSSSAIHSRNCCKGTGVPVIVSSSGSLPGRRVASSMFDQIVRK